MQVASPPPHIQPPFLVQFQRCAETAKQRASYPDGLRERRALLRVRIVSRLFLPALFACCFPKCDGRRSPVGTKPTNADLRCLQDIGGLGAFPHMTECLLSGAAPAARLHPLYLPTGHQPPASNHRPCQVLSSPLHPIFGTQKSTDNATKHHANTRSRSPEH